MQPKRDIELHTASSVIRNNITIKNIRSVFHVTKGQNMFPIQIPFVVSQSHLE